MSECCDKAVKDERVRLAALLNQQRCDTHDEPGCGNCIFPLVKIIRSGKAK